MSKARILFVVPDDVSGLGDILLEHGAEGGGMEAVETGEQAEALLGRSGSLVEFDFDHVEPIYPIHDLADALDAKGASYWGVFDAFVERSRGLRVQGRVVVNASSGRVEKEVPWSFGTPSLDARTLAAAGFDAEQQGAIHSTFTEQPGTPAP